MKKHKIKIKVSRDDSCTEGFAAYLYPSITREGEARVLLNIEATFHASADHNINPKYFLIENIMHEVGHALEEYMGLNFSEKEIEQIIDSYRKKYNIDEH